MITIRYVHIVARLPLRKYYVLHIMYPADTPLKYVHWNKLQLNDRCPFDLTQRVSYVPLEFTQLPSLCSPDRAGINVKLDAVSSTNHRKNDTLPETSYLVHRISLNANSLRKSCYPGHARSQADCRQRHQVAEQAYPKAGVRWEHHRVHSILIGDCAATPRVGKW